jgi:hypothetical protein
MKFIQIGFSGKNSFLTYFATFALTASTLLGVGLIPYTLALKKAGLVLTKGVTAKDAINALGENTFLALQLFPFVLALLVLILCNKFIHKRTILSLFTSRKSFDWKRFFTSFGTWGVLMFAMLGINAYVLKNPYEWNFNPQTFWMKFIPRNGDFFPKRLDYCFFYWFTFRADSRFQSRSGNLGFWDINLLFSYRNLPRNSDFNGRRFRTFHGLSRLE